MEGGGGGGQDGGGGDVCWPRPVPVSIFDVIDSTVCMN